MKKSFLKKLAISLAATASLVSGLAAQSYFYLTEGYDSLKKYDMSGNYVSTIIPGPAGFGAGNWADGLAIRHADGHFFIPKTYSGIVMEYDANGNFVSNFITGVSNHIDELAFDASGNLYIAQDNAGKVLKYSPTGAFLGDFLSGLSSPSGIAFDVQGNAYVTQWYYGSSGLSVWKWDHNTHALSPFIQGLYGYIYGGLEIDADGNVYLSQYDAGTILKFNSSGTYLGVFISGLSEPEGLAISPIPEPATYAMMAGLGSLGVSMMLKKRKLLHQA